MENQNNDPNTLEASPLSQIAIEFRNETKSKKRDYLLLEICKHYEPKIFNQMKTIKVCDRDEFLQIYRIEVYTAILKWNMKSNFETYLWKYILSVKRKFMNSIKIFKKDLQYCLFSDIDERYEPTNELIQKYYEDLNNG